MNVGDQFKFNSNDGNEWIAEIVDIKNGSYF